MDLYEEDGAKKTIQIQVFQCEKKDFVYVWVQGNYNSDPFVKILDHIRVVNSTFHFFREVLQSGDMLEQVSYQAWGQSPSSLPGCTNVMDRVIAPLPSKIL